MFPIRRMARRRGFARGFAAGMFGGMAAAWMINRRGNKSATPDATQVKNQTSTPPREADSPASSTRDR
jgi:hypothetical protein